MEIVGSVLSINTTTFILQAEAFMLHYFHIEKKINICILKKFLSLKTNTIIEISEFTHFKSLHPKE